MNKTEEQFSAAISECRSIFSKKLSDYGAAWRILRPESLTDQILIKARRIRSIETKTDMKIEEDEKAEFIGIVNYAIVSLIQLERGFVDDVDVAPEEALAMYDEHAEASKQLMMRKNHDYGEAWREMRISSYTDLILMKLFRVKQIEDNKGETLISEGLDANYQDIMNYAVFGLIKIAEKAEQEN